MRRRTLNALLGTLGLPALAAAQSQAPDEAGRQLRQMVLGIKPSETGFKPSPEFPQIFGAVMDWPVGQQVATVVALADGTASLYTTSTFGIIGGQAHESVRVAGRRFIERAGSFFQSAEPTETFPYPPLDGIAFYLLGYNGVRVVVGALEATQDGRTRLSPLFGAAQEVLTELRKSTGK